ncbi:polyprenyl synthetase family protein [Corynebacterium sp. ES2794-CONJ1]|uniref:polyprenyl synthetase family protein n=1 Tax=unclassified Corynebacterium TaxID=2624378 RepID=UPI00216788C9|nr:MULTISPECIES: polyprenyl synthetase family protein [unclassified Corynebacterium]MCS4489002.1 polyprenyl synthetase family protein [Corynebacterium sp. ES2775-CONJ]MCS4490815.1 polyprenyl synthetase family protein [Corynebacterium sp. ES2715-CONJ3]MCS4531302.1 polyprenyl synthetase family protein [Corynebacterium sp. ES2730-CONJ]MCU9518671.1 polyprenyl synthetase family protein [Corynebacterium sp. ES2794-CONJ1]
MNQYPAIEDLPARVEDKLRRFFSEQREAIATIGDPVSEAVGKLETFVLSGGKRMRPLCAWAGYVAAGHECEDVEAVITAISSLEFIQACALIHDDIIDSSDTRRGNPTFHRLIESTHRQRGWSRDSAHFGESVAILMGDLGLVWADDMFHSSGLSPAAITRALPAWRGMRTEVIGGQLLDIALEASSSEDLALANNVNRFKTAAYTIERPLHIGAALGDASAERITGLRHFGREIGIAFQLRDDQLGVFGDPEVTGKPAGDDLREGKRTVLLATALKLADPATKKRIRAGIGNVVDAAAISQLTADIKSTGADEAIEERIDTMVSQGLHYLEQLNLKPEVFELLSQIASQATARAL